MQHPKNLLKSEIPEKSKLKSRLHLEQKNFASRMKSNLLEKKDSDSKTRLLHNRKMERTRISKRSMMKRQTSLLKTMTRLIEKKRSRE